MLTSNQAKSSSVSPLPSLDHTQKVRISSDLKWEIDKNWMYFIKPSVIFGRLCSKHWIPAAAGIERLVQADSRVLWWKTPPLYRIWEDNRGKCKTHLLPVLLLSCVYLWVLSPPKRCISPEAWDKQITCATAGQPSQTEILGFQWKYFCLKFSVSKITKHWRSLFPYNYNSLTKTNNMRIQ